MEHNMSQRKACVIAVTNQKGGVGKTTLCSQTALRYAQRFGKRICVIDIDPQGNSSTFFEPSHQYSGTRVRDLFSDIPGKVEPMVTRFGIDLFHTPENDSELASVEKLPIKQALKLKSHIENVMDEYDYVFIDCPPSLGIKTIAVFAFADYVLIPVQVSGFAVNGLKGQIETIKAIRQQVNPRLKLLGVVINKLDRRRKRDIQAVEKLRSGIGTLLFNTIISYNASLDAAMTEYCPVWKLHEGRARVATTEIDNMIDEISVRIGGEQSESDLKQYSGI